jgi:thiol-disulfide isomerase/thioredoxin
MSAAAARSAWVALALLAACSGGLAACSGGRVRSHRSPASAAKTAVPPVPTAAARPAETAVSAVPELRVLDGMALRGEISRSKRKATLVNLWASWCGSCKREIPMLLEVARGMEAEGVGLVLVSADEVSSRPRAVELLREHGVPLPSHALGGSVNAFARALDPRWQGALPATFLLDAAARVRYFWNGPVLAHEISPIVQGLLAGEAIAGMTDYAAQ